MSIETGGGVIRRFWLKVDQQSDSACWLWIACKNANGYGIMNVAGRPMSAHRISWVIHNDQIPDGMCVCHKCDTPSCVNPNHLFLGTQKENMRDAKTKGRMQRGERHYRAKLNRKDVVDIKRLHSQGVMIKQLASNYGVHVNTISRVINKNSWEHVD